MKEKVLLILGGFFSVMPILVGLGLWIYGRIKGNKKLRHNGFIMLMLSLLIIFIMVFSVGAVIFYLWLNSR